MSSERAVLLDIDVFIGPRLSTFRVLDSQTHFKHWNFSVYTLLILPPIQYKKRVLSKEKHYVFFEPTQSRKEDFYKYKRDFEQRLCNKGQSTALVHKIQTEVQFSDRTEALRNKTKKAKETLPFVTTNNPVTPNFKKILMKH